MDIDFPLVLTWAVAICGAIWAFDALVLSRARDRRVAELEARLSGEALQQAREEAQVEPIVVEYARSFFPVLALVLVLRSFLGEPYMIPSGSMLPTLREGDFIVVNKFVYGLRLPVIGTRIVDLGSPERGDVMVFVPPHKPQYFIKRVVGLPGDVIRYEDKRLTINGEPVPVALLAEVPGMPPSRILRETLGEHEHEIRWLPTGPVPAREWVVPEGQYFMMGDNRDNSEDSRVWGPAHEDQIVGRAEWIWMHKPSGWNLPSFARNRAIE